MTCEVCGEPTSEDVSEKPVDGDYYTYVCDDDEAPEGAIGAITYEFCSIDHLRIFTAPVGGSE